VVCQPLLSCPCSPCRDLQRQLREKDGRIRQLVLQNQALQSARFMVTNDDLGDGTW
jgi:hypothetical protein